MEQSIVSSRLWLITLALALSSGVQTFAADPPAPDGPRPLSVQTRDSVLLLDDHTVAKTTNLKQQFFPTKKHPANPVMKRTEKWEGVGP